MKDVNLRGQLISSHYTMNAAELQHDNGHPSAHPPSEAGCVFNYSTDAFELNSKLIDGRRMAGREFFKAYCRHATTSTLSCLAGSSKEFAQFANRVGQWSGRTKRAAWLQERDLALAPDASCLFHPGHSLVELAWRRRFMKSRSHSLCGITHSLCSEAVMDAVGGLLTCPVQPWDALICTSKAARDVVQSVIDSWGDFLQARSGGRFPTVVELPVIPLGVDCDAFARTSDHQARRKRIRTHWHAASGEIVLLSAGRISFHAKANPYPLLVAAQAAAEQSGKKFRVVLAGQFHNAAIKSAFVAAREALCPSVPMVLVEGREQSVWSDAWLGADIFVSLPENVQETFGLTPLEAMAAGLPVVVSDWDGYRDTESGGQTVGDLIARYPQHRHVMLRRTIMWL